MKKSLVVLSALAALSMSPALAQTVDPNDNLRGIALCIDNSSFTAEVGALEGVSQKVAQTLYDHFVATAKANNIKFMEMGDKACTNWVIDFSVQATTGNPRAWLTTLTVSDDGAYADLNKDAIYNNPVVIWWDSYFGVSTSNTGLDQYLIDGGKELINGLLGAYLDMNS